MDQNLMQMLQPILLFGVLGVVFYFFLIRPQQQKMARHKEMLATLKKGDLVVAGGVIIGTIERVMDREVHLRVCDDVVIKVVRDTISEIVDLNKVKVANEVGGSCCSAVPLMPDRKEDRKASGKKPVPVKKK